MLFDRRPSSSSAVYALLVVMFDMDKCREGIFLSPVVAADENKVLVLESHRLFRRRDSPCSTTREKLYFDAIPTASVTSCVVDPWASIIRFSNRETCRSTSTSAAIRAFRSYESDAMMSLSRLSISSTA